IPRTVNGRVTGRSLRGEPDEADVSGSEESALSPRSRQTG
ncbi:MAG: hypothetical protein QOF53_4117, partial [Nocardioidaceae bacterium]|nr:hypothetical protein [Nocardioidaceae bacterium]